MKSEDMPEVEQYMDVTPYAGVWIEIVEHTIIGWCRRVTPYAGVWIEIASAAVALVGIGAVTPYAGVWIEISSARIGTISAWVTPYAGVWIEIAGLLKDYNNRTSHTLRGCVD